MAKSNEKPGNDWFSKAEICRFQGIAEQTFDKTYRGILPTASVKKTGSRVWYHGPAYFEAVMSKRTADATRTGEGDPLLDGGGDSPWLEKYREQKTRLAQMDADEREGSIVRVAVIGPALLELVAPVREAIAHVERESGRDVLTPVFEALTDAIDSIPRVLARHRAGVSDAGNAGVHAAPTPEHAGVRGV